MISKKKERRIMVFICTSIYVRYFFLIYTYIFFFGTDIEIQYLILVGLSLALIVPLAIKKASGVISLEIIYWQFGSISCFTWKHSLSDWRCPNTLPYWFSFLYCIEWDWERKVENPRHVWRWIPYWNRPPITIQSNRQYHLFKERIFVVLPKYNIYLFFQTKISKSCQPWFRMCECIYMLEGLHWFDVWAR